MNQQPIQPEEQEDPLALHLTPLDEAAQPAVLRAGDLCPRCRQARLEFDSLLNLICEHCHFTQGGCFT